MRRQTADEIPVVLGKCGDTDDREQDSVATSGDHDVGQTRPVVVNAQPRRASGLPFRVRSLQVPATLTTTHN